MSQHFRPYKTQQEWVTRAFIYIPINNDSQQFQVKSYCVTATLYSASSLVYLRFSALVLVLIQFISTYVFHFSVCIVIVSVCPQRHINNCMKLINSSVIHVCRQHIDYESS